jgi:hypothetical protein
MGFPIHVIGETPSNFAGGRPLYAVPRAELEVDAAMAANQSHVPLRGKPARPGTYYHVVPEGYDSGDILPGREFERETGQELSNKFHNDFPDYKDSPEFGKVSLFDHPEAAAGYLDEFLNGKGRVLAVDVPKGTKFKRNTEGYAQVNRVPSDWVKGEWSHRSEVANALAAGKPVPPEVLADYPDLAAKPTPSPQAPATTPTPSATASPQLSTVDSSTPSTPNVDDYAASQGFRRNKFGAWANGTFVPAGQGWLAGKDNRGRHVVLTHDEMTRRAGQGTKSEGASQNIPSSSVDSPSSVEYTSPTPTTPTSGAGGEGKAMEANQATQESPTSSASVAKQIASMASSHSSGDWSAKVVRHKDGSLKVHLSWRGTEKGPVTIHPSGEVEVASSLRKHLPKSLDRAFDGLRADPEQRDTSPNLDDLAGQFRSGKPIPEEMVQKLVDGKFITESEAMNRDW